MSQTLLKGKHVLVTGGSRGIGKAIVLAFAEAGALVSFIYNNSEDEANKLVLLGKKNGYSISSFKYNLANLLELDLLIKNISLKHGPIKILVNNAGIKIRTKFLTSKISDWDQTLSINLRSVYFVSQVVANEMASSGGGKIINIASQSGICHTNTSIEYSISKAGLVYLTKSLAKTLADSKITVNAVSPGRTYTELTGYANDKEKELIAINNIPLKRINSPEDIATCVLFFAGIKQTILQVKF